MQTAGTLHWRIETQLSTGWPTLKPAARATLTTVKSAASTAVPGRDWTEVHAQTEMLLDLCDHYHFVTQGAFDATSLPLSRLWDWKQKHDALPSAEEVAAAKKVIGWNRIQRAPGRIFLPEPGMMLDFGGVGKEFAVDCLKALAASFGIEHIMVDLGGDIAVQGEPPEGGGWYIGLEDPANTDQAYCGIRLRQRWRGGHQW